MRRRSTPMRSQPVVKSRNKGTLAINGGFVTWSRLSSVAIAPLMAILTWFAISFANDLKVAVADVRSEVMALSSTAFKVGTHEDILADHETRLRALERWQQNVINRDDQPL